MQHEFSKIDDALQALSEGRVIIVVDDEDRENEGDFIAAADKVTPEMIEFMITHGRGQVCMPILPEVAARLQLAPDGRAQHGPAPDAVHGARSTTGRAAPASAPRSERGRSGRSSTRRPARRPGPSRPPVSPGGQGRGRAPARRAYRGDRRPGPARRPDAGGHPLRDPRRHRRRQPRAAPRDRREHGLPIVSIEALIKYRRLREKLVNRVAEADLPTRYGPSRIIGYRVQHEPGNEPVAIVMGDLQVGRRSAGPAALVVLHRRSARFAAVRLRRPAPHGPGDDRRRRGSGP